MTISMLIDKLTRHEDLTVDEAAAAMDEVMEGRATPAQGNMIRSRSRAAGTKPPTGVDGNISFLTRV